MRRLDVMRRRYRGGTFALVVLAVASMWIALWLQARAGAASGGAVVLTLIASLIVLVLGTGLVALLSRARASEDQLAHISTSDPLTGVLNRRAFVSLAAQEYTRTRRYDRPLSVLAIDIDAFKSVNDAHGHEAGDEVLQALTMAWQGALRTTDAIGRLGGEEFAVLLPETHLAQARDLAERVRQACETVAFEFMREGERITVSVGVAAVDTADSSIDHAMARADRALREAKNGGRNRVQAFSEAALH
ncbi:MAG TPA: GGDEF domain-containing protein [Casimicrobiaceae bacterium]|nr:GGDEF domain-containing protein [Casimicrobiaceae bacterium]